MFVADTTTVIRETENNPIEQGMIEKLDEMLTAQGINHFFTLPINATNGIANNDEDCLNLFYDSKDAIVVELIYALWMKTVRNIEDERIYKYFAKKANN